jgi:antitoxin HicB
LQFSTIRYNPQDCQSCTIGYVAEIKDLPGCLTQGESIEETMKNINEARELWIGTVFELGRSIPLPSD